MIRQTLAALILASLAACGSKQLTHGNFVAAPPDGFTDKVTSDMVTQIVGTFPPASTRLVVQHPTTDAFGAAVIDSLRTKGYALQEFVPTKGTARKAADQADIEPGQEAVKPHSAPSKTGGGLAFSYVVDGPIEGDLYRITMTVGTKTFTRAYALDPMRNVVAASAWTRKD